MRFSFMSSSHSTVFSLRWLLPLTAAGLLAVGCGGTSGGDVAGGTGGASAQDASTGGEGGSSLAGQGGGSLGGSGGSAATGGAGGEAGSAGAGLDGGLDGSGDAAEDAKPDVFIGCPNVGDTKCEAGTVQTCQSDGAGGQDWKTTEFCSVDTSECKVVNGKATCVTAPTCKDGIKNQDETGKDCGGTHCDPCPSGEGCVSNGDCESDACANNKCMVCKAGTVRCDCGAVKQCNAQQTGWTTVKQCTTSTVCSASKKTCVSNHVIGTKTPTGDYYMYSLFKRGSSVFRGGGSGDSYYDASTGINWIYAVYGGGVDAYQVTLADPNGDPNRHPDNSADKGPIVKRTLKFIKTYHFSPGGTTTAEIYATKDGIYYAKSDGIYKFTFAKDSSAKVVNASGFSPHQLGYDDLSKRWFGSSESARRVYELCPGQHSWHASFDYPSMAGSHMDGMEVVPDPNEGITYVYVSDMTSDFIVQYYQDSKTHEWKQKNVFKYADSGAGAVEGLGFGAFNHFWAMSGSNLYELGGGKLQEYVEPG